MVSFCLQLLQKIYQSTVLKITEHRYNLQTVFERFTTHVGKAPLGFHAMTGSDQAVSFHSHTKQSLWNTFPKSTNDTLNALIHWTGDSH